MDNGEIPLSDKEFALIQERVYRVAGISLGEAKRTLVVSRLSKIIKALNIPSFSAYVEFLESSRANQVNSQEFVNALTTNLTRFYREDHHFDHLQDYVGKLISQKSSSGGKPRLRIWSAACSTGQEPYTAAMCLLDKYPELKRWDFRILATDIDTNVLQKAAQGIYPEGELAGLSEKRARVFERPGDGTIRIPRAMRETIAFKHLNLNENWPIKGKFDAIFCRNVAIYFDKPTQNKMFTRLGEALHPGGFLYIGHSENMGASSNGFSLVGKTIYQAAKNEKSRDAA